MVLTCLRLDGSIYNHLHVRLGLFNLLTVVFTVNYSYTVKLLAKMNEYSRQYPLILVVGLPLLQSSTFTSEKKSTRWQFFFI